MSDNENAETKAGAWTEAAKFQFLLRIVAQFREDGRTINWNKINMPGRTTKSLQNMWTKINKDISALEQAGGLGESTPKSGGRKKLVGENEDGTPTKTSKKRSANGGAGRSPKKMKQEDDIEASI